MNTGATTELVIGCCEPSSQRARALLDGTLGIAGCSVRHVKLAAGEMISRAFTDPALDVAELSLSHYVTATARGDCPYTMLPVYIARAFPHAAFYARTDRGISSLADLRGKRVGITLYQRTMYVWARGFLEDETGVRPQDVQWLCLIEDPADADFAFNPSSVPLEKLQSHTSQSELLESGVVDAIISARPPACFLQGSNKVKRIVENDVGAAASYYARTGVMGILHVMGVRQSLLRTRPELAIKLNRAFAEANRLAAPAGGAPLTAKAHTYGVGTNDLKALDTFLRYHHGQQLSPRRLNVEALFLPLLPDAYK